MSRDNILAITVKIDQGIVSVNAYGYCEGMTFPLKFKIFKPKERLKEGDKYYSKPELGAELVKELKQMGFNINGKEETRYIREIIYGKRRTIQYWQITTDKETVADDSTWFLMTKITNLKYQEVGKIYKIRAFVEQGFRNSKNELGWADFRLTNYADIQKWWELVMCAYLMVCLHNVSFNPSVNSVPETYQQHSLWDSGTGWKSAPPALRKPQRIGRSKQCLK